MRIGGNIQKTYSNTQEWLELVRDLDYSTVLSPVDKANPTSEAIKAYRECAEANDIVIGEVGIWNNPMSLDQGTRLEAIKVCKERLALAEALNARCCVNISGAIGEVWDGLYEENYAQVTYDQLVKTIQEIIDDVKPQNTFFVLETMPWMIPDSPEQYLQLIEDIDREAFGVHLDYVNMINSPKRYALRDEFITRCFDLLGPHIKSVHLKDIKLESGFPINLTECSVGEGDIDLGKVLVQCEALGPDMPVFVEHMSKYEEFKESVQYVRNLAKEVGVEVK